MNSDPSADEILAAVSDWLEAQATRLPGRDGYFARVAANALGIVRRDLALAPAASAEERQRLARLVGRDGDASELNRALCAAIRSGAIDEATPGLLDHLRATASRQMAIDQPHYRSPPAPLG